VYSDRREIRTEFNGGHRPDVSISVREEESYQHRWNKPRALHSKKTWRIKLSCCFYSHALERFDHTLIAAVTFSPDGATTFTCTLQGGSYRHVSSRRPPPNPCKGTSPVLQFGNNSDAQATNVSPLITIHRRPSGLRARTRTRKARLPREVRLSFTRELRSLRL
jgi:hypothetical protein